MTPLPPDHRNDPDPSDGRNPAAAPRSSKATPRPQDYLTDLFGNRADDHEAVRHQETASSRRQPSAVTNPPTKPTVTDQPMAVNETAAAVPTNLTLQQPAAEAGTPAAAGTQAEADLQAEADGPPPPVVVLVDAHSLIYQLFHALPPMTSPDGAPVAVVHGFIGDMLELITRHRPSHLICAFDKSEVTFRNQLYDQYKANRESMPDELRQQIPTVREVTQLMGIGVVDCSGFEADDILATVAKQVETSGSRCLIVTADKDCRQLITDNVHLYNIRKHQRMTAAELLDDWGIRPDQVVDYQALVGDPVDNVPGIPLIGPKIAQQLLTQFGDLDTILDNAASVSGAKRQENLRNGRERALLSRQLVQLRDDVPCQVPWDESTLQADLPQLRQRMEQFGFRRVAARAEAVLGHTAADPATGGHAASGDLPAASGAAGVLIATGPPPPDRQHYRTISDRDELAAMIPQWLAADAVAIDTETTGTDPRGSRLVGISLAWQPGHAAYLPIRAPSGAPQMDQSTVLQMLQPLLASQTISKIGHNLKFDLVVLRSAGAQIRGPLLDTMVADYLIDPGRRNHSLDDLALRYLEEQMTPIKQLIGSGKNQITMDMVDLATVSDYACEDVDVPLRAAPQLIAALERLQLDDLYRQVEIPLVEVLAEMEFNGIEVDVDYLASMSDLFSQRITALRQEIIAMAGTEFNLDSPKQLAKVLFEELGLPIIKKTKTGASTDAEVLETLSHQHPLPAKLLEYRQATKLKNTYIDTLPRLVNPTTGRVHTSFRQDVAATGRLSSSDPNLQNIPIRTEEGRAIRGAFRAGHAGWKLLAADYSQIELRVLAHFCGDEALLDAYHHDRDIHSRVAAEVYGVQEAAVTSDMRRVAKTINFGIIYGQSPFGLARTLGIGKDQAAEYIELYFARYPGVQDFMLRTLTQCRQTGYVSTILGRRRNVVGVRDLAQMPPSKRRNLTEAERIAVNTVIQGSAADLIKQAMVAAHRQLPQTGLRANLLLQIHDELLWEVHADDADQLSQWVRQQMTEVMKLQVPLKVEVGIGNTWADLK